MANPESSPQRPATDPEERPAWVEALRIARWPLALVLLALVAFLAYRDTLDRAERAGQAALELPSRAADRAEAIASKFLSGNITETFLSALPEIDSAGSGLLEVATVETTETFSKSDERWALWDMIPLGTTESEIRVPVTYRYHLRFDDPWRLDVSDRVCIVYAPSIRPTLPPAIHTEGMEKRSSEDWLRFDGDEQLAKLEQSMTPRLRQMAGDPRRVALVRDPARRTVAEFVRAWLLREEQWGEDGFHMIKVVFADEIGEQAQDLPVTITLDDG